MSAMDGAQDGAEQSVALGLQQFLHEQVLRSGEAVGLDEPLFETGRVDSIGLLQLVEYVAREHGVDLLQRGRPADLRTLATLAAAVLRESAQARSS
ncbi:MAG: acyl carrier protein [Myxococcales bacterium]